MSKIINFLEKPYNVSDDNLVRIGNNKYSLVDDIKQVVTNSTSTIITVKDFFFDIDIHDCDVRTIIENNPHKKPLNIVFKNCIFNKTFSIKNGLNLCINTCQFSGEVDIFNAKFEAESEEKNIATFHKAAKFYNSFTIIIKNNRHCGNFIFKDKTKFDGVSFNVASQEHHEANPGKQKTIEVFIDKESSSSGSLEFIKCDFNGKFKIRNIESKDGYRKQQENKARLTSIKFIDCNIEKDSYLRVGFLNVDNFEIRNLRVPPNTEVNIGDCKFKEFKLINFRNSGLFKIYKINILDKERKSISDKNDSIFQIDNTSIGNADFQSVNLDSFRKVKMFDNIFHNLKYTNIIWKDTIEVDQTTDDDKNKFEKQQDIYRTLKNVTQANNDHPQAIKFYAKEMENVYELEDWKNLANKSTLWFNKNTNSFGLNWWQPLLILFLVITPGFYLLLLYSLDMPISNLHHWQYVVQFLNPIHKFDWVIGFLPNSIDFLFRVLEGLLLYQIITAFRKYSRKL